MNRYNFISTKNNVKPNYDLRNNDISFEIYVSPEDEVCIIGKIDNNYICWCSITRGIEKEINAEIINHLLLQPAEDLELYSTKHNALGTRYEEIQRWHFFTVKREWYKDHYRYRSPVSHSFFGTYPHNNGLFLATEIQKFYRDELSKCQFRLIDDVYVIVLKSYRTLLMRENSPEHYYRILPIIDILNNERYLKLCSVEEVRRLYLECLDLCSNLYNSYMTAAR